MSNKKLKSSEVVFEYTGIEEREVVPRDVTIVRFDLSVIKVDDRMFRDRETLRAVVLNEGLQKIGYGSFRNCRSLKSITFPSTVTEIGNAAFGNCCNLETVILNKGLKKIEQLAFAHCTLLERITIPHTVTEISDHSFYNCHNMREVGLHEGIQMIVHRSFHDCPSLERFKFPCLSTRLENIIRAGQTEVESKIDQTRRLVQRRGSELFVSDAIWVQGPNWGALKGILGRIDRLLTYYELKEATMLLELAMWKSKIDQAEVNPIERDEHRIDIPGPVKNTILQYLDFRIASR